MYVDSIVYVQICRMYTVHVSQLLNYMYLALGTGPRISCQLSASSYCIFTARAMLSEVLAYRRRRRPPSSFHHRGALKCGGINRYRRTTVVVIYSAMPWGALGVGNKPHRRSDLQIYWSHLDLRRFTLSYTLIDICSPGHLPLSYPHLKLRE